MTSSDMNYLSQFGPDHNRRWKLKYTKIPVDRNFALNKLFEAQKARNQVVENHRQIKDIHHALAATNFKSRVSKSDWFKIQEEVENIHPFVEAALSPDPVAEGKANPTVGQVMQEYLEFRASDDKKNVHGAITKSLLSRYTYWRDKSGLRDLPWAMVTRKMIEDDRDELQANNSNIGNNTANKYCAALSASHRVKFKTVFYPEKLPLNIAAGEGDHTMPYSEDDVRARLKMARGMDQAGRERNMKARPGTKKSIVWFERILQVYSISALRKSDLQFLRVEHIKEERSVIEKRTKGGKISTIPLFPAALELLMLQVPHAVNGWVFPSTDIDGMPNEGWYTMYRQALIRNGLYKGAPYKILHSFRSFVAAQMALNGGNMINIADVLNVGIGVADGYRGRSDEQRNQAIQFMPKLIQID